MEDSLSIVRDENWSFNTYSRCGNRYMHSEWWNTVRNDQWKTVTFPWAMRYSAVVSVIRKVWGFWNLGTPVRTHHLAGSRLRAFLGSERLSTTWNDRSDRSSPPVFDWFHINGSVLLRSCLSSWPKILSPDVLFFSKLELSMTFEPLVVVVATDSEKSKER